MTTENLTAIDGKLYSLDAYDTEVFDPAKNAPLDLTGQPLRVGTKVAWGTSYRGGGGSVVGEITDITWVQQAYSAHERNDLGGYVTETYQYEGRDYSVRPSVAKTMTGTRYLTIPRTLYRLRIVTKSLQQGRKGNSFSSPHDVVAIANQQFVAA